MLENCPLWSVNDVETNYINLNYVPHYDDYAIMYIGPYILSGYDNMMSFNYISCLSFVYGPFENWSADAFYKVTAVSLFTLQLAPKFSLEVIVQGVIK